MPRGSARVLDLGTEAFEKAVARHVKSIEREKAGIAIEKTALDLMRFTTRRTPIDLGRAAAGWLAFPRSRGRGNMGVRGKGVVRGLTEGSYRARLTGRRPFVELTNRVPYIVPLEVGARAHVIRARNARALRFIVGGRVIFRRSVRHPGMRGYHALARSMRDIRRHLERHFGEAFR